MQNSKHNNIKIICIIPAAGKSTRFNKGNKLHAIIKDNKDVLGKTISNIKSVKLIDKIYIGLNVEDIKKAHEGKFLLDAIGFYDKEEVLSNRINFYEGGDSRQETVFNGLNYLKKLKINDIDDVWVIIHDAARPTIFNYDILGFINSALKLNKSCIMAIPISDTIKKVDKYKNIVKTVSRNEMWLAQTPQMFKFNILFDSLKYCIDNNIHITDESQALEILNHDCAIITGRPYNIKITEDIDLIHARCLADINCNLLEDEESDD